MRFCTTCGRNFETSIDICPHDGTPLFGMAGEEENTAQDELVAEVASVLAGDERDPVVASPFSNDVSAEPEVLPDEDEAAQEEDLFGAPLANPADDFDLGVGLDDTSDPFAIAAQAADSVADEPSEDLFAADSEEEDLFAVKGEEREEDLFGEDGDPSEAEEDFFEKSAGLDEDDLFGEPEESPGIAQADSDVSQQIAASIDGLLDEIDDDKGQKPLSMSSSLGEDVPAVADSYDDEYVAKKGSKMPLLIILMLIIGSVAGVYLFMNGSITNGVKPDPNTPAVVAPKPPVQPAEEAVVEEAEAAEPAAVEEEPAAEIEEPAAVEEQAAVVEEPAKPAVVPAAEVAPAPVVAKPAVVAPAPKPVVAKEKPAPAKPVEEPAETVKPKKTEAREPTAEELLEEELKRMAP